jgi:glycosyltransferase involved in cell wall biosynthesis
MLTGEYPPVPGGVGDYTARLTAALHDHGHQISVLTSRVPGLADGVEPATWRRIADWGVSCWRPIESALCASRADLLHIQYQPGAFQLKGGVHLLPRWLRWRRPATRVVTTFHDLRVPYLFPKAGRLRALAVRLLVQSSHAAIFVDPADLQRAGSGLNRRWIPIASNVTCAPPPDFERQAIRRSLGAAPEELLIGYFGFLSASKGATDLFQALRLLRDRRPARLVLIGATAGASNPTDQADRDAALTLATQLGLTAAIATTGFLSPAAISAHLLACDIVALPYTDGASFRRGSLLAALEHGCPIVTTTPPPQAQVGEPRLEPGRQFLSVPPGDPAALATALSCLADDPALRERLSVEARALAARCSWSAIATATSDLYQRCWPALDAGPESRA